MKYAANLLLLCGGGWLFAHAIPSLPIDRPDGTIVVLLPPAITPHEALGIFVLLMAGIVLKGIVRWREDGR